MPPYCATSNFEPTGCAAGRHHRPSQRRGCGAAAARILAAKICKEVVQRKAVQSRERRHLAPARDDLPEILHAPSCRDIG